MRRLRIVKLKAALRDPAPTGYTIEYIKIPNRTRESVLNPMLLKN